MFKIIIIIGVIFGILSVLLMWAMCAAAGRADRWAEEMREKQMRLNEDNWWHE